MLAERWAGAYRSSRVRKKKQPMFTVWSSKTVPVTESVRNVKLAGQLSANSLGIECHEN